MVLASAGIYAYSLSRVSVHDPSIVWEPASQTYYVFGSHQSWAKSTDLMNWSTVPVAWRTESNSSVSCQSAFSTNATKTVTVGGAAKTFGNFDVKAFSASGSTSYDISGNLWAPDVIYNKAMQKWCMYLSINGDQANCSIVLLTADNIAGPYLYQGPVVFSGFYNTANSAVSYKNTDLELVLGEQASLPTRYATGNLSGWRHRWPNCIDPCVFYDEEGKLWMSYGSWHGGIWMLELDEQTGLRDYDVAYTYTEGKSADDVRQDPYYGIKIAGGQQVSGEASYIQYIDGYYYLFITYGGLVADGGYQMRVFRSASPTGPYADPYHSGGVAIYDEARVNYGPDGTRKTDRGENIFGAYGEWGYTTVGDNSERSQGHNSVVATADGRTFMAYHTRFQNRGEEHELRIHQVFRNADGWLCAAPFEYTGEMITDASIKTTQHIATDDIAGQYKVLLHTLNMDHANKQLTTPVDVELKADGTVSGDMTGTWAITAGTSYITITVGDITYSGVMVPQTLEPTPQSVPAFTAVTRKNGNTLWGYKVPNAKTIGSLSQGWFEAGSSVGPYTLKSNQTLTFTFTVDATKDEYSWQGYVGIVTKQPETTWGDNQYVFLRSQCDYACGGTWNTGATRNENNYDGANAEATRLAHLPGAAVTMQMQRQEQQLTITTDITNHGVTYHHLYEQNLGTTADVYAFLAADAAQLTVTKVEITDNTSTAITTLAADGRPAGAACYDLQGRRILQPTRGLYIVNGRKVVIK